MGGRKAKVTAALWIETARRALIDEGVAGVKVDRLAQKLGVTRGGFYHNFRDRDDLLAALLHHWEEACRFTPPDPPTGSPADAVAWLDRSIAWVIEEKHYDPRFDMAVREWARSDPRAAWAVEREDRQRLSILQQLFETLRCSKEEAEIRARVLYYHQIGYYALNVKQTLAERRRVSHIYLNIICGEDRLDASRKELRANVLRA